MKARDFWANKEKVARIGKHNVFRDKRFGTFNIYLNLGVLDIMSTQMITAADIQQAISRSPRSAKYAEEGAKHYYNQANFNV